MRRLFFFCMALSASSLFADGYSGSSLEFADGYSNSSLEEGGSGAVLEAPHFEGPPGPAKGPFFWLAEKDSQALFILGTVHFGVSLKDLRCSEEITGRLLAGSRLVFVESRLAAVNLLYDVNYALFTGPEEEREKALSGFPPEERQIIEEDHRQALLFGRKALSKIFPDSDFGSFKDLSPKTQDFLASHGADRRGSYFDYFFYLMAKMEFEFLLRLSSKGMMDTEIAALAKSKKIELKALEESHYQALEKTLEGKDAPAEAFIDRAFIEELAETGLYNKMGRAKESRFEAVKEAYKSGDGRKVNLSSSLSPAGKKYLLEERNRLWLKRLKAEMEGEEAGPVFVAAGVKHFIGPANLLNMLEEEGFLIRRLEPDCSMGAAAP